MSFPWSEIIASFSGLTGVFIGAWATSRNQRFERRSNRIREQLDIFYGPMLGLRAQILAKSETRDKISGAADAAWRDLIGRLDDADASIRYKYVTEVEKERFPDFEKIIEENNRKLIEEILPLYKQMIKLFTDNMSYSEPTTRQHYGVLVEFVEIWERWIKRTIPGEALRKLGHSEDRLFPLYSDIAKHMAELSAALKGERCCAVFIKSWFADVKHIANQTIKWMTDRFRR